jgi:hypothetical protein
LRALCEQSAGESSGSPTRFHNSVHNAAAGYWGIATKSMAPCQVLCGFDASFGAGLMDALAQVALKRQSTLLIAYDSEYPEPLFSKRDTHFRISYAVSDQMLERGIEILLRLAKR